MAYLIKGAHVFAPEDLGVVDVLTVNDKVVAVGKDLSAQLPDLETIDAKGLVMTPGFIDQHIHVTGGGGEGGPKTRTPELVLSELAARARMTPQAAMHASKAMDLAPDSPHV